MVETQLQKKRKLVAFSSRLSPETIEERMINNTCGAGTETAYSVMPTGSGLALPVASSYNFTVERGVWPDGSRWVALRMDGLLAATPAGVKLTPRADGGTEVIVLAADRRKLERIEQTVDDGTFFCHWREFDYPFD